jgi:hypothetical protein
MTGNLLEVGHPDDLSDDKMLKSSVRTKWSIVRGQ